MMRALAIAAIGVTMCAGVLAQQNPQTTFRTRVDRVRVDAMVVDKGMPVTGLGARDFEVRDNGRPVRYLEVTPTNEGISVAIALGLGESARGKGVDELIDACQSLANALEPRDRAWIVTFTSTFALKAGPTNDAEGIRRVLSSAEAGSGSSLWDAMFGAVSLSSTFPGRSLVLLFTDGVDRGGWLNQDKALEVLRRSDVVVNGIRPPGVLYGFNALESAAKATGGIVVYAERGVKLEQQFVDLLAQFRVGYVLSFPPPAGEAKNGWHDLDLRLKNRKGTVRARDGYFEPGR
jgi:VWFA-related protein